MLKYKKQGSLMETLQTERLILRDWLLSDVDAFFEYAKVDGVGEMAGWPHHQSIEESLRILKSFIDKGEVYAVVLKESNKVIGSLGIMNRSMDPEYPAKIQREIGYVLSKDYWGHGLMSEAVKEAIKYTFEKLHADVIWCGHFDINDRSRRVVEKCGFKFYKKGVYEAKLLGKNFDDSRYLITREEYFS